MAVNNLIKKFVLLCLLELLFGVFICYVFPADQKGYMASIQDKELLLSNSKPPRIIFVGGSNLVFGLDSEQVEKEFGLPVINFGLHGSLGLQTSFNIIMKYAAQGDIIVVVPEYEYFEQSQAIYGANDVLSIFIEIDPANVQYIARNKWIDLPLIALNMPEKKINRKLDSLLTPAGDEGVYIRANFNRYGDMVGHLKERHFDPNDISDRAVLQPNLPLLAAGFDILEEFHQKIIDKGGIVLFDFPALKMQNCKNTGLEEFDGLTAMLKVRTTVPVLSTPYDRCYPDNYFYDTEYHLNNKGRKTRTQQVIGSLHQALSNGYLRSLLARLFASE